MTSTPNETGVLGWPLEGTHRIEASAGTGKTFALTLLYTRLIVERGLSVKRVLAVTYTIAATEELRERLRRQLARAMELALLDADALQACSNGDDGADAATAAMLLRRRDSEQPADLARRLARAASEIDLAPIHTIHAYCQRLLAEHALASGEPLLQAEFVASERALQREIAYDIWRHFTRDAATASRLQTLWSSPDALARDLRLLLASETLLPTRVELDDSALIEYHAACAGLSAAWRASGADARRIVQDARDSKILAANKPMQKSLDAVWVALAAFDGGSELSDDFCKHLATLTPAQLIENVNAKHRNRWTPPDAPLFLAVDAFLVARARATRARGEHRVALLHDVRDFARARMGAIKRARGLIGFDDLVDRVHAALSSPQGAALAAALREDHPAALVDEFQDTDAKQWDVFRRIYVDRDAKPRPTLFLIGDPKQAIYRFRGGDVHTYHSAGASAESTETLERNYRSRPRMIEAVSAVFARGGEFPFADDETRFPSIAPGGKVADADFGDGRRAAPGLHLVNLSRSPFDPVSTLRANGARDRAAEVAATEIKSLLDDTKLRIRGVTIAPGDIAVLVNRHEEGERMQRALAARGVASVTATRKSVYSSAEAVELVRILEALLAIGSESRLRAALATVLVGADAATIDALSRDEASHRDWLDAFQAWRQQWERFGPLVVVNALVAKAAPRLLKLADGERRLTNYLHLAEETQVARASVVGEAGQAEWLARRIAEADDFDDLQQLRLESDADRVRIMTLHKAKGLEFDLVFMPFAAIATEAPSGGLKLVPERVDGRRVLRARIAGVDDDAFAAAEAVDRAEIRSEQLRLLYVGLTRARHAAWLYGVAMSGREKPALAWLLHRGEDGKIATVDADAIDAAFAALHDAAPRSIAVDPFPDTTQSALALIAPDAGGEVVRESQRVLRRDWWVHSFSQLAREDAGAADVDERGAEDEPDVIEAIDPVISPYIGARFGNALHDALETIDFAKWRDWGGEAAPAGEEAALRAALAANGYLGAEVAGGLRLLVSLVRGTVNVRLPEGTRLADTVRAERCIELEFHFALRPVRVERLIELLHRHDVLRDRNGFGLRERLEGLMTGRIDLVYRHAEKIYLLDYKSNRLADYSEMSLTRAIVDSEYDLQYLIYTLALHRWLRFRRADYDYDAHFGGVRYLFCRGLDPASANSPGIFVARPSRAFIDELDALLAPPSREFA